MKSIKFRQTQAATASQCSTHEPQDLPIQLIQASSESSREHTEAIFTESNPGGRNGKAEPCGGASEALLHPLCRMAGSPCPPEVLLGPHNLNIAHTAS